MLIHSAESGSRIAWMVENSEAVSLLVSGIYPVDFMETLWRRVLQMVGVLQKALSLLDIVFSDSFGKNVHDQLRHSRW